MYGTIKFYNDEKRFGMIEKDGVDYFFHKSDVENIPEKIYKSDTIESFDVVSKPKGPTAKNIVFKVKIICQVCSWKNKTDDIKCSNSNCGFTLKYAKGLHTDVSDEELKTYRERLKEAKAKFNKFSKKKTIERKSEKNDLVYFDKETNLTWEYKNSSNLFKKFFANEIFTYANHLNNIQYAGYSDWRVPSEEELQTLITYKCSQRKSFDSKKVWVNEKLAPNTFSGNYFTNSDEGARVGDEVGIWYVIVSFGTDRFESATNGRGRKEYLRCVRG